MAKRGAEFKPLLFTTTVRNPARLKGFLYLLEKFNGKKLTDALAIEVCAELVRYGLYRPMKVSARIKLKWEDQIVLSDEELKKIMKDNPQNHKEAGFAEGWPSRFATQFDFAKELGFVYFEPNSKIEFSQVGLKLAQVIKIEQTDDVFYIEEVHPEFEQQAFLHALAKYQRKNPFVRVLNDNVPLILLLEVIRKLNSDSEYNGAGINRLELPLVIFWKDNNANDLYLRIKKLRKKFGYNPSPDVIFDICKNEIMGGNLKEIKLKSLVQDYPDEFIRKMRLTGLISLRGAGRFLDLNKNEIETIEYVLKKYSKYKHYTNERDYFDYMAETDDKLVQFTAKATTVTQNNTYLSKWITAFGWEKIKSEYKILSESGHSRDEILKIISPPTRLEFLTALAIKCKFPALQVVPNYICDDEGVPTSTAPGTGNQGDIECFEGNQHGTLVEVTMLGGVAQTKAEVWPITRHLEEFSKKVKNSKCYFIAPTIFKDSRRQINFVVSEENLSITPFTVSEFLTYLDSGAKSF